MVNSSQSYQVSPVENVTTLTWYCENIHSGAKTELDPMIIHVYAGSIYGLLIIVVLLIVIFLYWKWGSFKETKIDTNRAAWIQGTCVIVIIIGVTLFNLIPLIHTLIPKSTTTPETTATSLTSTYEALTLGKINDFHSTEKPLSNWNGIPIVPEAIAGQQANDGVYMFKVPETMDSIGSFYKEKLKALGWNLVDSRWAGMRFTKNKSVLLVTIAPATDLESFIVTLVFVQ